MVSSKAYPDLERAPGKNDNWVESSGGLPDYIERVAKHIHYEGGKSISQAISMAISQCRKWAAQGKAKAIQAIAQWEKLKATNRAKSAVKMSADRIRAEVLELSIVEDKTGRSPRRGPYTSHVKHTKQFGKAKGNLGKAASWQHPYQPRTQVAGALKAKHVSKEDLDSSGKPKAGRAAAVKKPLPASAAIASVGRKEQHTGAETAKKGVTAPVKSVNKTPAAAALRARRNALAAKVKAGTATPAERSQLNKVIAQLKKAPTS